jgi:hypothetical protein
MVGEMWKSLWLKVKALRKRFLGLNREKSEKKIEKFDFLKFSLYFNILIKLGVALFISF